MLLRICLVIAILAGAGVIVVGHLKVRPHIEGIIDERNKNAKDRDTEKAAKVKAQKDLKDTIAKLKETEGTLAQTQTQLAASKKQTEEEQKRANGLKQELDQTRQTLNTAQQELAAWVALGIPVDQIKGLIQSEKNLRSANQALDGENKVIAKRVVQLETELKRLRGSEEEPPMRAGLNGKVLVVDPKWSFVILDIGDKQGAVKDGVLMVCRNSKLVAKVKIMSLQAERCIANIMPGWKLAEVMEGDRVLY